MPKKTKTKKRETEVQKAERHLHGLKKISVARETVQAAKKDFRGGRKTCLAALSRADKALASAARTCG